MRGGAHEVRPLGAVLEEELVQLRGSYCDKHKEEKVKLYCYDCNENICLMCSAVKHRQHKAAEIPEAAKTFSLQINSDNEQIWSQVRNVQEKSQEKQKKQSKFLREVDKVFFSCIKVVFRVFPFYILNNDMGTEALRLRP